MGNKNQAVIFERYILILKCVQSTPVATTLHKYEKNFRLVVAFAQVEITDKPVQFFFEKWGANDINLTR